MKLALLSYLAVAHFGRGRGSWKRDPRPEHWQREISVIVEAKKDSLDSIWKSASHTESGVTSVNEDMELMMRELGRSTLSRLYPKA